MTEDSFEKYASYLASFDSSESRVKAQLEYLRSDMQAFKVPRTLLNGVFSHLNSFFFRLQIQVVFLKTSFDGIRLAILYLMKLAKV